MKHESDSSIWKSLAVAFGDGLAFGVGMKIAQSSAARRSADVHPDSAPEPAPPAAAPEPLDLQMLTRLLASIDARLSEHTSEMERRLDESRAQVESGLQGRLESAGQSLEAELESRLQAYVEARLQAFGDKLHLDITQAGDRTARLLVDTIEMRLLGRIAALEREVRTLRAQRDGAQQRLQELIQGFSRACQEAMREMEAGEQAGDTGPGGSGSAPGEGSDDAAARQPDSPAGDRRFDSLRIVNYQARPERKLAIPLVSSVALALAGLLWLGAGAAWF